MHTIRRTVLAFLLLLDACGAPSPPPAVPPIPATAPSAALLSTGTAVSSTGVFRGTLEAGAVSFKGIPYALPPAGDLRWKPPVGLAASTAPIDATRYGPACPQSALTGDVLHITAPVHQSEACLNLNIWTPARTANARLPVMVWVHGGWFARGNAQAYPGYQLATKGGVVVVTLDYRLGPLGFLVHPALQAESPSGNAGNQGLLDQIEALRWVRNNIAGFGGDPDRVTVFGQSAGGFSVCYLLASPLTKGLFQRAIMESGTCGVRLPVSAAVKARQGLLLADHLGCPNDRDAAACLRGKPVADVLAALPTTASYGGAVYYSPNRDHDVLPDDGRALLANDTTNPIPVMMGSTSDDASRFVPPLRTRDAWIDYVHTRWPRQAARLLALYPVRTDADTHRMIVQALTDMRFTCPALQTATLLATHGHPTFLYRFTHVPAFGEKEGIGAYHAAELPYVFGNLGQSNGHMYDAEDRQLSERLIASWSRFAASGTPNGPGLPDWEAFDPASDRVQQLDLDEKSVANPVREACAALHAMDLQ